MRSNKYGFSRELVWVLCQMGPYKSLYVASLFCTALGGLMALLDPLIIKWLVDSVLPKKDIGLLIASAIGFLGVYFGRLFLNNGAAVLNFRATHSVLLRIRTQTLRHLQTLSAEFYDQNPIGDITFRVEQDVDKLREAGGDFLLVSARTIFFGIFIVSTMFVMNLPLSCLVLPLILLFLFMRRKYDSTLRRWSEVIQERSAKSSVFLQEGLFSIVQLQILRRETSRLRKFFRLGRSTLDAQIDRRKNEAFYAALSSLIIAFGLAMVLAFGGYEVIRESLTVGSLIAFYSYLLRLFDPLANAVDIQTRIPQLKVSIGRLLDLLEHQPAVTDHPGAVEVTGLSGEAIVFRNVTFGYKDRRVLQNFHCVIRPGAKVVLVGRSGSGKSTIAKLLLRLYDVENGEILIGDRDIRDLRIKSLRTVISLVPQDPVLFNGSFLENLLLGNPAASIKEIEEAVRLAQLEPVLKKFPRAGEEYLGPRGTMLSGGERQRLALAQAVLRRPDILVLDESTSALDGLTEASLLRVLRTYFHQQTVLLVSHRPSVMLWADEILLLDNGRIAGSGTHDQLYEVNALYRKIFHEELEKENQLNVPVVDALEDIPSGEFESQ